MRRAVSPFPLSCFVACFVALLLASAGCAGGGGGGGGGDDDDDDGGPGPGEWTPAAPLSGGPRQETAVVALDGLVYVLGGFDENGSIVADVEVFDPIAGTWDSAPSLPVAMHHANGAVAGGRIWVTGFLTGVGFDEDGRVFSWAPGESDWAAGPAMPLGTERGSSGVGSDGTTIWLAGGIRETASSAFFSSFAVSGTSGTWTGLDDLPAPRDHLGAGVIDGVFYAAGGRAGTLSSHVSELLAWDGESWSELAPMPTSRGGVASAVKDGRLYVFGGEGNPDLATGVFDEAERFDPATGEWTPLAPMGVPRHGTGAAAAGDCIWVPGGADEDFFAAVDTNECFSD